MSNRLNSPNSEKQLKLAIDASIKNSVLLFNHRQTGAVIYAHV